MSCQQPAPPLGRVSPACSPPVLEVLTARIRDELEYARAEAARERRDAEQETPR